jgi:hypothetical protein
MKDEGERVGFPAPGVPWGTLSPSYLEFRMNLASLELHLCPLV